MTNRVKAVVTLAASALLATWATADVAEFNAINAAARAARERGDHAAYLTNARKLAAFTPNHPGIQIALARGLALTGDGKGAVAQLNRIADLGLPFAAADDVAFQKLKDDPEFIAAAKRLADNGKGTGRGKGIIKLGLTGGSEGVAWSETMKSFLMGSSGSITLTNWMGTQRPSRSQRPAARRFLGSARTRPAAAIWFA